MGENSLVFFLILFTSDVYHGSDPSRPQQGNTETPQEVTGGNIRVENHHFKSLIGP